MRASTSLMVAALLSGALVLGCGGSSEGDAGKKLEGTGGTGPEEGACTDASRPGTSSGSCILGPSGNSFCMDYIGSSYHQTDIAEQVCDSAGGLYSSSACDLSAFDAGGCLTNCGSHVEILTSHVNPGFAPGLAALQDSCRVAQRGTWIEGEGDEEDELPMALENR